MDGKLKYIKKLKFKNLKLLNLKHGHDSRKILINSIKKYESFVSIIFFINK
jgi:hypothetical protein